MECPRLLKQVTKYIHKCSITTEFEEIISYVRGSFLARRRKRLMTNWGFLEYARE
jgi:hypothetical protein